MILISCFIFKVVLFPNLHFYVIFLLKKLKIESLAKLVADSGGSAAESFAVSSRNNIEAQYSKWGTMIDLCIKSYVRQQCTLHRPPNGRAALRILYC